LTDGRALAHAAQNDKDQDVRLAAVKCLTDQEALVRVAQNDKEEIVRTAAIERVTDERLLADIVMYSKYPQVTALERVTDQGLLADVAKTGCPTSMAVLGRVTQYRLAEIAKHGADEGVRNWARYSVKDEYLQADIAKYDEEVRTTCPECRQGNGDRRGWEGCMCKKCGKEKHQYSFQRKTMSAGLGCCAYRHYVCRICGKDKAEPDGI
jgi:hypothetical protein